MSELSGAPRATCARLSEGKKALQVARTKEAAPRAEDFCQTFMNSGTCRISLVIVSMTLVLAFFSRRAVAIPRQAPNSASIEIRASSYASVLVRFESFVHSKPRLAVKERGSVPSEKTCKVVGATTRKNAYER